MGISLCALLFAHNRFLALTAVEPPVRATPMLDAILRPYKPALCIKQPVQLSKPVHHVKLIRVYVAKSRAGLHLNSGSALHNLVASLMRIICIYLWRNSTSLMEKLHKQNPFWALSEPPLVEKLHMR